MSELTTANTIDRSCWICLESDNRNWIYPCECRGSLKWVHSDCLLDWIDMKQITDPISRVCCPQCKYEYQIDSPDDFIVSIGDPAVYFYYHSVTRSISAFLVSGLLYCACYGHGLASMTLMLGKSRTMSILEQYKFYHPKLLLRLPFIPMALILSPFYVGIGLTTITAGLVYLTGDIGFVTNNLLEDDLALCVYLPGLHYFYQVSRSLVLKVAQKLLYKSSNAVINSATSTLNFYNAENQNLILSVNEEPETALDYYYSALGSLFLPVFSFVTAELFLFKSSMKPFHKHLLGGCIFILCRDLTFYTYRFRKYFVRKNRNVRNNERDERE